MSGLRNCTVKGSNNVLKDCNNVEVRGSNNVIEGTDVKARGSNNVAKGPRASVVGSNGVAEGVDARARGSNSVARGLGARAEGSNSVSEGAGGDDYEVRGISRDTWLGSIVSSALDSARGAIASVPSEEWGQNIVVRGNGNIVSGRRRYTTSDSADEQPRQQRPRRSEPAAAAKQQFSLLDLEGNVDTTDVEELQCTVCMDKRRNVILEPCKHVTMCVECARHLGTAEQPPHKCPSCRAVIESASVVYM